MKVYALISWYDEKPEHLARCVASCAGFSDHVVAVDGAYAHFPDAERRSAHDQAAAIRKAARENGLAVDVYIPRRVWAGGEVEKRAFLFEYARRCGAAPDDWLFIIDADTVVTEWPEHLRATIEETLCDVADVTMCTGGDSVRMRVWFRALPGLTVKWAHYLYVTPKGDGWRWLWHYANGNLSLEWAEVLDGFVMDHRRTERTPVRDEQATRYYQRREWHQLERRPDEGSSVD